MGIPRRFKILVCRGPECGDKRDSAALHAQLVTQLRAAPLPQAEVEVGWQSCFGHCTRGPNLLVREVRPGEDALRLAMMPTLAPGAVLYHGVRPQDIRRIIQEHLKSGRVLVELTGKTGQRE